ncbi:hypothetical protein K3G63_14540 [Hymenobacter sp. HSC-4F20]|uniref:hypothetical protein n=1 Tax=Hymenobacter sp. HSC-4F20 TaxID=2864135 RepID=UPI001C72D0B3|nr:hypothetical protein [Hymenobacter sp. HSC-4F20]MBX0291666.1 hypothetical protein [Hymenobacter sp. HSC-4F20]
MRPTLEYLRQLERHLLGQHTAAEAEAWRVRQLLDSELAADADTQQLLYQGLQVAGRQQLRRELELIHARLERPSRRQTWWQAATSPLRSLLVRRSRGH